MKADQRFFEQCVDEYRRNHPEVFNSWMHLYGEKWMRTYDLQIRVIRHPGDLSKLLKP